MSELDNIVSLVQGASNLKEAASDLMGTQESSQEEAYRQWMARQQAMQMMQGYHPQYPAAPQSYYDPATGQYMYDPNMLNGMNGGHAGPAYMPPPPPVVEHQENHFGRNVFIGSVVVAGGALLLALKGDEIGNGLQSGIEGLGNAVSGLEGNFQNEHLNEIAKYGGQVISNSGESFNEKLTFVDKSTDGLEQQIQTGAVNTYNAAIEKAAAVKEGTGQQFNHFLENTANGLCTQANDGVDCTLPGEPEGPPAPGLPPKAPSPAGGSSTPEHISVSDVSVEEAISAPPPPAASSTNRSSGQGIA